MVCVHCDSSLLWCTKTTGVWGSSWVNASVLFSVWHSLYLSAWQFKKLMYSVCEHYCTSWMRTVQAYVKTAAVLALNIMTAFMELHCWLRRRSAGWHVPCSVLASRSASWTRYYYCCLLPGWSAIFPECVIYVVSWLVPGFMACLRNPWECLNSVLKIRVPWEWYW